jgi:hypothetical protein
MTLDPFTDNRAPIDRAQQAIGPNDPPSTPTTNGHTWHTFTAQDLRGIPAIGRGVQGCIPETEPGWNLDHWPNPDTEAA